MNTLQARFPSWVLSQKAPNAPWPGAAARGLKAVPDSGPKNFELTAEESSRFLRIVAECGRIRSHYDVYRWLGGEVQFFLPHEILISAWGDFETWDVQLDLTSGAPGVRTRQLAHCRVESLVRQMYAHWTDAGRQPVMLNALHTEALQPSCHCPIHTALRGMRSVLVHGMHDKRSGRDSLFIALSSGPFTKGRSPVRFFAAIEPLMAQIDSAFRKISAFPLAAARLALPDGANVLDLSVREREVLESVCRGRTNLQIAAALGISPFTVKNHVQRIFRKIGVTNRTQAAARYNEAVRQTTLELAKRSEAAVEQSA
jgi:transcriptional regulator EpsA